MASALAVLADDSVKHGPLEVLLTMTEEAGWTAHSVFSRAGYRLISLINTDSEEEGEIYMGCAGGIDVTTTLALSREAVPAGYSTFTLTLKGLQRRPLRRRYSSGPRQCQQITGPFPGWSRPELGARLVDFQGGTLRNAIPREATSLWQYRQIKPHS